MEKTPSIMKVTRSFEIKKLDEYCSHLQVEVDEFYRLVKCVKCGGTVDPFEYILSWARQERRVDMEIEHKRYQLKQILEEYNELKKQLPAMRSRLKKSKETNKMTLIK